MTSATSIEWTDLSWNPVTGCDRVSPGCDHCYALDLAARLKAMGQPRYQRDGKPPTSGPGFGVTLHEDKLTEPLRWRKPRMVFVNSMSDLFHPKVPDEFIDRVFLVMALAHESTFQVLTKRPKRMRAYMAQDGLNDRLQSAAYEMAREREIPSGRIRRRVFAATTHWQPIWSWPPPNVWLGTSIESADYVDRATQLRATPAVRFVSAEPLLGPLAGDLDLTGIDWLIVGGESGPEHRPMKPEWVRDLRDLARATDTAFFFKQWGGRTPKAGGRRLDGLTWSEFPVTP